MDANENETADGVSEYDDGINKIIDTEENVVNENGAELIEYDDDSINKNIDTEENVVNDIGAELMVFKKKDIRSKVFIGVPIIIFALVFVDVTAGAMFGDSIPSTVFQYTRSSSAVELMVLQSCSEIVVVVAPFIGIVIDVFPINGLSWKSYALLGLVITCSFLITIASYGDGMSNNAYMILTALVTLGLTIASTAIRGYIPWVTKREPRENKGYFQSVMVQIEAVTSLLGNFTLLVAFSGPLYTCTGYEQDPSTSCSTDAQIMSQNPLSQTDPDNWCHDACPAAWSSFNPSLTIMYASLVVLVCVLTAPSLVFLKEGKKVKGHFQTKIKSIWVALTRRSLWQIILFTLVFNILTNIKNPAEDLMTQTLMDIEPQTRQIADIIHLVVAIVCIYLYMKFFLKSSRRKLLIVYLLLLVIIELIKLLPVYNVTRNKAIFYIMELPGGITDLIPMLIILNAINGIIEPGQETTVHAVIMSCIFLGKLVADALISSSIVAFFPSLVDAKTISKDTPEMKNEYLKFEIIIVIFYFLAIFSLPMLPRQAEETQVLYETNERSTLWATVTTASYMVMLLYTAITLFITITTGTGPAFLYTTLAIALIWCFAIPTCVIYLPMVRKKEKFDWSVFI